MENAFTLLPMSQNFTLDPGETYTGTITIVNPVDSKSDFAYSVSVSPYSVVGEDYQADISNISAYSKIAEWITIPEPTGTIAPNESREVEFTINVPENAPAGGQYAAIMVSSDPSKQESEGVSINNVFALGSIIYADVAGEITHEGTIIENNVPEFSTTTPVTVSALVDNHGNVHETAIVALNVSNAVTGEKIFPTDEDQNNHFSEIVMPETTRYITRNIDNLPPLGIVKVEQTIYYNNEVSTVVKDIILCPVWFIFLVVLVFMSIAGFIFAAARHHRHKKATI
ncbi:hypothetical protein IJJ53_00400 [Candidatus Saccharibacteria bacterium]|nr:hypothetical protein [Candidatus Saccharibacteria bacterium]